MTPDDINGLISLSRLIAMPYILILAAMFYRRWKRAERRVKDLEAELYEKPKRKNDEIDPTYQWVTLPNSIRPFFKVRVWKDDDERRKAMALMHERQAAEKERRDAMIEEARRLHRKHGQRQRDLERDLVDTYLRARWERKQL